MAVDAKSLWKEKICAIRACLIPALYGRTDGASYDGEEKDFRYAPLVKDLVAQRLNLDRVERFVAGDVLITRGVLSDQCAFSEEKAVFFEALLAAEFVDLREEPPSWDADERVFDSWRDQKWRPLTDWIRGSREAGDSETYLASKLALRLTFRLWGLLCRRSSIQGESDALFRGRKSQLVADEVQAGAVEAGGGTAKLCEKGALCRGQGDANYRATAVRAQALF